MFLKIYYYTQFRDPTLTGAKVAVMTQVRKQILLLLLTAWNQKYEDWNFNSGNYLFTTDTK